MVCLGSNQMSKNFNIGDAFKALNSLTENVYGGDEEGIAELAAFLDDDNIDEVESVIDPTADSVEDLEDSYDGKVILLCNVCHSLIYKDPSEVIVDEDEVSANVGEECVYCQSPEGYKVVGQVAPYEEEVEDEVEVKVDDEEVEVTEDETKINESVKQNGKRKRLLKEGVNVGVRKILAERKVSKRDDIDAEADDKKETAKKKYEKAVDDADADRDYRLKKGITRKDESCQHENCKDKKAVARKAADSRKAMKEAVGEEIRKYQKWVDYDMKHYGKISDKTMGELHKAGLTTVKDNHGDWEVTVKGNGTPYRENKTSRSGKKVVNEKYYYIGTDLSERDAFFQSMKDAGATEKQLADVEAGKSVTLDKVKYSITDKAKPGTVFHEGFDKVEITANGEKFTIDSEPDEDDLRKEEEEKGEEVIKAVDDQLIADIQSNAQDEVAEEDMPEEEVDIEEIDEVSFDELGEGYLKRTYENVKSYKTTGGKLGKDNLIVEGIIEFTSGKKGKTSFKFENATLTKSGKIKFLGENKQFSQRKGIYSMVGTVNKGKLICESMTYDYRARDAKTNKGSRINGTVSAKKKII